MAQDTSSAAESPRRHSTSSLLRDQVKLVKKKDYDRYEIVPITNPLSFEKGFFIVIRACQLLAQKNDGLILVGVAGPSGAGTEFTEKVLNFMPSIDVISMDSYKDPSRIIDDNFDDPRLTDYDTLLEDIHHLKAGKPVQVPIYDFKSGSRTGYRTVEVPSSRIVIIEGIYALSEKLQPLLDLRVSITGGVHFNLVKRVLQEIQHTGQEPEEIIHQISETVYPMYKVFIEPYLQTAHIKIINKFNPFSGFQNCTYILKSTRLVTVDQIKAVISGECNETMEETCDIYLLPPAEDPKACQSYLRMRNRDGKYNLMFEEWVTDAPFIISPRITFEVSVRLLGRLMALGYTVETTLKRSSHVFSNDKVCVKIDLLEQLNRQYIQVQGRDRLYVKHVAKELGLEGSYVPRTYIEQIQLEKLANDVTALPDDVKKNLSIDDDLEKLLPSRNSDDHSINIGDTEDIGEEGGSSRQVWIFLIANLGIELLSAAFDQLSSVHKPEYALVAMLMAFIGLLGCIAELAFKGGKERVSWRWDREIPWFYYSTTPAMYTRFGTFPEIFGLVCAILQSISATVAYVFYSQHADNPIKGSFWSVVFAFGLLCSQILKDRSPKVAVPVHRD
ncbi:hypothetical protein CRYUN_Cryun12cG0163600 [Craigia yunnanensis]